MAELPVVVGCSQASVISATGAVPPLTSDETSVAANILPGRWSEGATLVGEVTMVRP